MTSGKSPNTMMASMLSDLGLTRKAITKDDSLFRAVSETLFFTQSFHERLKSNCIDYLCRHKEEYQPFVDEVLADRLKNLMEKKIQAGTLEMIVLSRMYRLDFILYHPMCQQPCNLTPGSFDKKIHLWYVEGNNYELIYTKEHIQSAAICQSIVYDILYRGVFGLDKEIEEAVLFLEVQKQLPKDSHLTDCFLPDVISLLGRDKVDTLQRLSGRTSPPLPYRIAKALHPGLYRNVELDIVQEEKREARQLSLGNTKGFSPGDKCQVVLEEGETPYNGHIQSIDTCQGTVVVYIEELGAKKTVPSSSIRPIPLTVSRVGDLPVANIDLKPYLKKARRRKPQPLIPVLTEEPTKAPAASYRSRRSSSCSSGNYNTVSDINTSTNSNSSTGSHQNPGFDNSFYNTGAATTCLYLPPASSTAAPNVVSQGSLAAGPVSYTTYPPHMYVGPYIDPRNGAQNQGNIVDQTGKYCPTVYSCVGPQGDPGQVITALDPAQPYYMMTTGPPTNQAPMYWMPMVAVPYAANMGQVNLGWSPSQDPYGRDVPHSDMNALRFVSNPGVEYYRMNNPEMGSHVPSGAVMMENCSNYSSMGPPVVCADTYVGGGYECVNAGYDNLSPVSGGEMVVSKTCGTGHTDTKHSPDARPVKNSYAYSVNNRNSSDTNNTRNIETSRASISGQFSIGKSANINAENNVDKVNSEESIGDVGKDSQSKENDEDDDVGEGMDVGSDGDSGCPSECADLSPVSGPDSFTASELTQSETGDSTSLLELTSTDSGKPRGKRRYYMYGNHKLVKPIKEIPLRFQMLLAETSAAKARCEGQPIYMQHCPQPQQPMYDIVYYQTNEDSQAQLNANASCFFPTQDGGGCVDSGMATAYVPECYASGYTNTVASNPSNHPTCAHAAQAPPLFVPAVSGSSHSTSTQNCQTIIVYSSHSTQATAGQAAPPPPSPQVRTISMPPPFPPPPNLPPPPLDIISSSASPLPLTCNQLVRSVATNNSQPKTTAMYADHHIETYSMQASQVPSKPLGLLNVPPPNLQSHPTLPPSSMGPPTNHNMVSHYSTPTYISVQPPTQAPTNISGPHLNGSAHHLNSSVHQLTPSNHGAPPPGAYPVGSSNHYMYVYPSPPAGQPTTNPHVVYMVSPAYPYNPAYQQQGVLVPSNCPVPVQ